MFYNTSLNWGLRAVLAIGFAAAFYVALTAPLQFSDVLAAEDGSIEYATAIFLFVACGVLIALLRRTDGVQRIFLGVYALAFFWAAGEEVSWGQRIFGFASSEFFIENNRQGEVNLHNMVVGDAHLAEFVFGTGLAIIIMLYLVALPLLYPRIGFIRKMIDFLAAPLPTIQIGILAILATAFCAWIDLPRQWEVYEFAFSIFICLIFLNPANRHVFGFAQTNS